MIEHFTKPDYECECKEGFTGDGYDCEDYDECREECWNKDPSLAEG